MHRPMPRRPAPQPQSRAAVMTLADDLSVIARIEQTMRAVGTDHPRRARAGALNRLAGWLGGLR